MASANFWRLNNWTNDQNGNTVSAPGVLNFAYVGSADSGTALDADICSRHYAPLDEMSEVDGTGFTAFTQRVNNDPQFAQEQYLMQQRMEYMSNDDPEYNDTLCFRTTTGTNSTQYSQLNFTTAVDNSTTSTTAYTVPDGCSYSFNIDSIRLGTDNLSDAGKIRHALMQIFEKVPKSIKKMMSKDEKKLIKAKYKSEKLLKQWLSADEYKALRLQGEIELPSQEKDDEIFIVKKDPNAMVEVKKKETGTYSHKLCLVAEDMDYPIGDQLLSKIMMLKTDEKQFREIAIRHG